MARLPNPGGDDGTWGSILNDFLGQVHNANGTLKDNSVSAAAIQPNAISSSAIADGSITAAKLANSYVDLSNTQSIGGVKTFTSAPVVPSNSFPESAITNLTADLATIPSVPQPADNYLLAWTGPPEFFVSNVAPTATEVYLQRVIITVSGTINNLYFFVTAAGSGMTSNQNFVGIYNTAGTKVATSADCSSSWTSTHVAKIALTSGLAVTKGQTYYVAMLFNGTTMPQIAGGAQSFWDQPNVGNGVANWASASPPYNTLAPNRFRYMSWSSGETSLPASVNLDYGNPDKAFWIGVG